ncbi:MAG: LacI family DNA-binding transcriptional regulator [Pseudomonadota bacterium]
MRDVARIAGVSTMTVSRVLAQPDLVAEATRRRVLEAVDKLGYVPDLIASGLSSKKSGFIAAVLPTLNNINFAETAGGLTDTLRAVGFQLLIGYTNYRLKEEEALVRALLARRPEGIVLTGSHHSRETRQLLLAADIPVIQIWDLPSQPLGYAVGFSNFEVGRAMTLRLIERGYRRIAFLGPSGDQPGFKDFRGDARLAGHVSALQQAGLDRDLVIRHGSGPVSFTHGAEALGVLLDTHQDVDAVFGVSDLSAVGAAMECHRRGIKVPDDLAIAGFGDFEIGAQIVPSLTTVRIDCAGIGRRTGELLLDLLAKRHALAEGGQETIDVGFELIERQSTRRPAGSTNTLEKVATH